MSASRARVASVLRAILINGALLFGSLLFAVVAMEIALRLILPQQLIQMRPDLWQPADTFGWMHRPNVRTTINTGERTVSVFTDAQGFRVGPQQPPADAVQVLVLGDSFMEALQVEHEQSFAGLLQDSLAAATGIPVAVRNAGIDDWGPSQYYLRARSLLENDEYDLIVTSIFVGNDVQPARIAHFPPRQPTAHHRFHVPRDLAWPAIADASVRPLNDALETRSHLYVMVRKRLHTVAMRLGLSALHFPREFLSSNADSDRWSILAGICADIDSLAAAHGARALFVLVPTSFQVDDESFAAYVAGFDIDTAAVDLDLPNQRLMAELQGQNLEVIDMLPGFRAAHDGGLRLYGVVDPHLTPDGHAVLTRLVAPEAARLLRAPASEGPDS